jgi:HJR/Mrr/RecB family endonuclease
MERYKIFTFGGAGGHIAHTFISRNKSLYEKQEHTIFHFNTDKQSIDNLPLLQNKYSIGKSGLGSGNNIEVAKKVFDEERKFFNELTNDNLLYILIGGFSGATSGGFLIKMTELLKQKKKNFVVIGSLPFLFEGNIRFQQAQNVVETLRTITENVIVLPCENLRDCFGELTLSTAFMMADYYAIEAINIIIDRFLGSFDYDEQIRNVILNDRIVMTVVAKIKKLFDDKNFITTNNSKIIIPDTNYNLLKALTIDYELIYRISPRKFEEIIEYIYRLSGYETILFQQTKDNGVDIIVYTPPPIFGNNFITVIQVKKYRENNKVGVATVRDLLGTRQIFNADKAQIITTSDFTQTAQQIAQKENIDLVRFMELNSKIQKLIK